MASINAPSRRQTPKTHEGGTSVQIDPLKALRRSVLTCLLWEDTFYEKGNDIAKRIAELVTLCKPEDVTALAIEAREKMQLRHAPLFLVHRLTFVKGLGRLVADTLSRIVQRPDELTEYLTLYWKDGRRPISAGSKRGLRAAFGKFSRYQLAKYREADKGVKLVDVLRIVRPKAKDADQNETYRQLRKGELVSSDTWEAELSAGKDKKATFERLLSEKKLGGLATLRNLRNMQQAKVDDGLIRQRLSEPMPRVWPYRFVTAAKFAPSLEDALEQAMFNAAKDIDKLPGHTALLVDVSGSMNDAISRKGKPESQPTSRIDVACGLAILLREKAERVSVATFSNNVALVPPRRGFALRDAIDKSQPHGSTMLAASLRALQTQVPDWAKPDRVVVITDEQSHDGSIAAWTPFAYVINVAAYQNGVGDHSGWTKIDGWSERVFDYIAAVETEGR